MWGTYEDIKKSQKKSSDIISKIDAEVKAMTTEFVDEEMAINKRYASREECELILTQIEDCKEKLIAMRVQYENEVKNSSPDLTKENSMTKPERECAEFIARIQTTAVNALDKAAKTMRLHAGPIERDINSKTINAMRISSARKGLRNTLTRCAQQLERANQNIAFARPVNKEEKLEQDKIWKDFVKENTEKYKDLPVIYHGSPIGSAYKILETGQISSSVDRLGYSTSWDVEGSISVTTPKTVDTSVSYLRNEASYCIPNGVIFAMTMRPEEKEGADCMTTGNIDFKEKGRLIGIITDQENIDDILNAFPQYDGLVYTPDEFCLEKLQQIERAKKNLSLMMGQKFKY